ncbi:MAG: hypothetical protein ACREQ8_06550 [Woeseiaceae bacterium]
MDAFFEFRHAFQQIDLKEPVTTEADDPLGPGMKLSRSNRSWVAST